MKRLRVLCGVDEATGSLAAVRGLRAAGFDPWIVLTQPHTYVQWSHAVTGRVHLRDPKEDAGAYAARMADEAEELDADIVLPCTEATLRALTGREHLFSAQIGTASPEALDKATDKAAFVEMCRDAGLSTPTSAVVDAETVEEIDGPLPGLLKPLRSVFPQGDAALGTGRAVRVDDRDDVLREVAKAPGATFLLQALVEGTLSAICGVAWRGEVICAVHQFSPRIWPPGCGNSSYAYTVARDERLEQAVRRVIERIGWSGIFGIQFLRTAERAYAIDLNPRMYGSAALAIAAGHNLPAIWVDLILGKRPLLRPYRVGVRYRFVENDLRALAHQARHGPTTSAIRGFVPRRDTVHAVFALRDPLPALEIARKVVARSRQRHRDKSGSPGLNGLGTTRESRRAA